MSVYCYRSTDAGSPVLTGEVGSLEALLISCLVTGYNLKTPAGWTNPYFDAFSNSAFKAGVGGNEFYVRIADDVDSHANLAYLSGFATMTDIDTGTERTPSVTQNAYGVSILKSATQDATGRGWIILASHQMVYMFINHSSSSDYTEAEGFCFGEFKSFKDLDTDNFIIAGRDPLDYTTSNTDKFGTFTSVDTAIDYNYLMKSYTSIGSSVACGKHADTSKDGLPFPNLVDGNLFLAPVFVHESGNLSVRGVLPGLWHICHPASYFTTGDTFTGNGALAGKEFLIVKVKGRAFALETSDTWDI